MGANNPSYVKVNRGPIPTWNDYNALADLVQRQKLKQGIGYLIKEGPGGTTLNIQTSSATPAPAWPWKVYNTTRGTTGQVQINGSDGFVAQLNGFVANVNGNPNNVQIGTPLAYPQLAVTGNGIIYGYAVVTTPGNENPIMSLDIYYGGTLPSFDPSMPPGYFPFTIATISNYAVDDSGNVTFTVANATNTGWSELYYCGWSFSLS